MPLLAFFAIPGLQEIGLLLALAVLLVWPAWRICARAGFPGTLGLLAVIPVLNLFLFYFLAFAEWPALPGRKAVPSRSSDQPELV